MFDLLLLRYLQFLSWHNKRVIAYMLRRQSKRLPPEFHRTIDELLYDDLPTVSHVHEWHDGAYGSIYCVDCGAIRDSKDA